MIQIVDNYDSFTYNLVQRLGEIDARLEIRVDRNDEISVEEILKRSPDRVILSPGPCNAQRSGDFGRVRRASGGQDALAGRLSGASVDWPSVRGEDRACRSADARQDGQNLS